jgi:steroid 5-alpha reductase family enzyme
LNSCFSGGKGRAKNNKNREAYQQKMTKTAAFVQKMDKKAAF